MDAVNTQKTTGHVSLLMRGWLEAYEPRESSDPIIRVRADNVIREAVVPVDIPHLADTPLQSVVEVYGYAELNGGYDVATAVEVVNRAERLPVDLRAPDLANDRYRHLHLRTPSLRAAVMFRHYLQKHARAFLEDRGFFHVHTPIITEASCVCSGDVFTFPYYDKKIATLIQSPWMYADSLVGSNDRQMETTFNTTTFGVQYYFSKRNRIAFNYEFRDYDVATVPVTAAFSSTTKRLNSSLGDRLAIQYTLRF